MTIQTQVELQAWPRTVLRKKVRVLRREGLTVANIYGHNIESKAIQLETEPFLRTLRHTPRTALMSLRVEGETARRPVLIRHIQRHPTSDAILHIDFYQVSLTETMHTEVPVHLVGTSLAVEDLGGMLLQELNTVEVECLPGDLPQAIEIDIGRLREVGDRIVVGDLAVPEGVTILNDPDVVVAMVSASTVREEIEAEEAAAEAEQAAEEAPAQEREE